MIVLSGKSLDDVANSTARIQFLEATLREKTDALDGLRFVADSWKERLGELRLVEGSDQSQATLLRQSITVMRNSLFRLKRQESLMLLRNESSEVELEVLRRDLNQKQSNISLYE